MGRMEHVCCGRPSVKHQPFFQAWPGELGLIHSLHEVVKGLHWAHEGSYSKPGKGDPALPPHQYRDDCYRWPGRWEGSGECQEFGGDASPGSRPRHSLPTQAVRAAS